MSGCRFYRETFYFTAESGRHFGRKITIARCSADEHETTCGGGPKDCDKEPHVCMYGVWQGCEVFCRHSKEVRECKCDIDFCDLSASEQSKIDWSFKKEGVCVSTST